MALSELQVRYSADTGCQFLEERDAPIKDRITVTCLTKTPEGVLIDPETGWSLSEMFTLLTGIDYKENEANKKIEKAVGQSGKLVVWWSLPDPRRSNESRVNWYITYEGEELEKILPLAGKTLINKEAALKRIKENGKLILLYALPAKLQHNDGLEIAPQIAGLSPYNPKIESGEQLRVTPLVINIPNEYWVEVASEFFVFDNPEVWQRVKDGTVFSMRENTNKVSVNSAKKRVRLIELAARFPEYNIVLERVRAYDAEQAGMRLKQANKYCPTDLQSMHHMLANILSESFFPCPRCKLPIPSGFRIEKCPHCRLEKKDAPEQCD